MATGYTDIIDNPNTTFKMFVLRCARAFGACVSLREEPLDSSIPKIVCDVSFYETGFENAKKRLEALNKMSAEETCVYAYEEYVKKLDRRKEALENIERLKNNYNKMLDSVNAWIPPSSEHQELKEFMLDQINDSIKFDCDTDYYTKESIVLESGDEWLSRNIKEKQRSLEYHSSNKVREIERVNKSNEWIEQLVESLDK